MKKIVVLLTVLILGFFFLLGTDNARLLRFPDINRDQVVFVYAGDIWSVPATGGDARRLTSHPGLELFPKISPDGRWIAFSAEYSGSRQVYVMTAEGGTPRQLTWYNDVGILPPRGGYDYVVLDWTPDSQQILVRCNRTPWGERMGKYFLVSLAGGLEKPLAIPEAGGGTFSPDGKKIVYTPIEREFRTWKRTLGGRAQDVWIYDLEKNAAQRITDFPGTDRHPTWFGSKIYFVSDRELILNIFAYDLDNQKVEKVTRHEEYDVLWPSGENGWVVYENGGYLYKLDLQSGQSKKLAINIKFDNPNTMPYFKNVSEFVNGFDISPTGKRAILDARGDLFSVPEKEGITSNLTDSQGVRETDPAWSPDGQWIAYSSDRSGEYEIYLAAADGSGKPRQLTSNSRTWRFPLRWSPDSRSLLFANRNQVLQILDINSGNSTVVDHARLFDITDYNWSADSHWVVYTKDADNRQNAIWAYSLDQKKSLQLSDGNYDSFAPVFSKCGKYIFFLSNRNFNLVFSSFERNYLYNKATRIYALALTKDTPPLFPDKNDMEPKSDAKATSAAKEKAGKNNKKEKDKKETAAPLRIDQEGSNDRIVAFPLESGDYDGLASVEGGILYSRDGEIHSYTSADKKDAQIIADITAWTVSADGKKILYRAQNKFAIIENRAGQQAGDGTLNLDGLSMKIDPLSEWRQIYADGWRIFRDWFYVRNLHGVDWTKMRERYGQLVPYLGHRADLDFIFGELVGEINAGHTYVEWGDFARVPRIDTGLLGAELRADEKAGRYVISKIYHGENWNEPTRSPLTEQGVAVRVGDYLMALNGHEFTLSDNPYRFLENTAGKRISIRVSATADAAASREYWIKPIKSEQKLFNKDWVESRRQLVDRLSGGRIGYIYVPNTSVEGNTELFKGMYAYKDKEALIIDDRYNGGGFIPSVMADLLSRRILNYWARRGLVITPDPDIAHDGPKVMLINGYASSGGDALPYYFRKRKLGLLIGTRTWGGLIGLSGNPGFVDGGALEVPTFGFVDTEGHWAVEGKGVSPDIEVIDRPDEVARGQDPCIEKAVQLLLEQLKHNPPKKVTTPAEPDRSQWIEKESK